MIYKDKWKWTAWNIGPKQQKNKGEEGVKVLHTKSQAGRTQKSGPPATRFECHLLRCTVKLRTACGRGETGKNRERRDRTQLQDVRNLRLEWWNALQWHTEQASRERSNIKTGKLGLNSLHLPKAFTVGIMLASLSSYQKSTFILWKDNLIFNFSVIVTKISKWPIHIFLILFYPDTELLQILVLRLLEALSSTGIFWAIINK